MARNENRAWVVRSGGASLAVIACLAACTPAERGTGAAAERPATAPEVVAVPATAPSSSAAPELPGIHNVYLATPEIYSGSVPEGHTGFDSLKQLGIRTVISVDGARPDVAAAEMRGMQYVHLPIGYDGIPGDRRPHLLRALRDLPGPIYIHCHHGKHRSPAATAYALVGLGRMTPEEGVAFLKAAGTSKHYVGLYDCVADARAVDAVWLDGIRPVFPAVAALPAFVGAMTDLDAIWERLGQVARSNWQTPEEHPDLLPAAEAVLLAEAFREMQRDVRMTVEPADFALRMKRSEDDAWALADALRSNDPAAAKYRFDQLAADCTDCHHVYRDAARSAP